MTFPFTRTEAKEVGDLPEDYFERNSTAPLCNRILTGEDVDILIEHFLSKEDAALRATCSGQAIQNMHCMPPDVINNIGSFIADEMKSQDYFIWAAECWYIANLTGMSFRVLAIDSSQNQKSCMFFSPSPDCDHLRLDPSIFQRADLDHIPDLIENSKTDPPTIHLEHNHYSFVKTSPGLYDELLRRHDTVLCEDRGEAWVKQKELLQFQPAATELEKLSSEPPAHKKARSLTGTTRKIPQLEKGGGRCPFSRKLTKRMQGGKMS